MKSIITLLIVALALSAAAPGYAKPRSYCRPGGRDIVLFVDRSTVFDETDRGLFQEGMTRIYDGLAAGDRLRLHTIGDSFATSESAFDRCKPGCPERGLQGWLDGSCNAQVARADTIDFRNSLFRAAAPLVRTEVQSQFSEIAGTLSGVLNQQTRHGPRTVIVFSDMLENSSAMPFTRFNALTPSAFAQQMQSARSVPELRGDTIVVFGVGRGHDAARTPLDASERDRLRRKWAAYFAAGSVSKLSFGRDFPEQLD